MKLTLYGRIPSKKNARVSFIRGGKMINIPSKNYQDWNKEAVSILKLSYTGSRIEKCIKVSLTFFSPDKRKYDLSNKTESVMDTLVDAGILEDDNYNVVPELILKHGGLDKENPRCEIEIVL